jgi:hypothetical protein
MQVAYRLRDDAGHIENVQKATRSTKEYGIEPTDGLFGSRSTTWSSDIVPGRGAAAARSRSFSKSGSGKRDHEASQVPTVHARVVVSPAFTGQLTSGSVAAG